MEILIKDIPEEGLQLHFESPKDGWFQKTLADALAEFHHKGDAGEADFQFYRTGDNVDCSGEVHCDSHPVCCRCLKVFSSPMEVPIHLTLAPLFGCTRELEIQGEDEVELVKEDLGFAFYEGNKFNLGDLIREQVILAIPIQSLCAKDCKGLCQSCGKDINEDPCGCRQDQRKSKIDFKGPPV